MDSDEFLGAGEKAADADLLDGMDSADFLGAGEKAADSNLLDGMDSDAFLQAGDPIDADTLDGNGPEDFVRQSGDGIWLVQGDVSGWQSKVGAGTMTTSPDFDETTFTSTSTSGNATHFIVPELPLAAYGLELEMAGIEICYDASSNHSIDGIKYSRTANAAGVPTTSTQTLDALNRQDEGCHTFAPLSSGLPAETTVALEVDSTWTANGGVLKLGRVTFMLQPTSIDATPLN